MKNGEKDLISVIVPVYNVAPYLNRCIQSVLAQTYSNLEIIVVDDGSTDNSGLICDDFASKDARIKVIHQDNKGLSGARNTGTNESHGKYICFVDSDDEIDDRFVESLHNVMILYNVPLAMCSYVSIFEKSQRKKIYYPYERATDCKEMMFVISTDEYVQNFVCSKNKTVTAWSRMYSAELAKKVLFPVERAYEDMATHIQYAVLAEKIAIVSQPLYMYHRQRDNSITNTISEHNLKDKIWAYQSSYEQIISYDMNLKDKAKWIIREVPLSIMLDIYINQSRSVTKEIDIAFIRELRRQITKNLFHGDYNGLKTCLRAVLVLYFPYMIPLLWKIVNGVRRKGKE